MDQRKYVKSSPYSQPLRCEKFLNQMNQVMPWEMLCELIQPFRPIAKVGRKRKAAQLMLRIYCLQQWYNLSDPGQKMPLRIVSLFSASCTLSPLSMPCLMKPLS